jgi:hypothetical protein
MELNGFLAQFVAPSGVARGDKLHKSSGMRKHVE